MSRVALTQGGRASVHPPTWHKREGTLPPLIASRIDVERLAMDVASVMGPLEAVDTVDWGDLTALVLGTNVAGRTVSTQTLPLAQALDTLHRYLEPSLGLTGVMLNLTDQRHFRPRAGLLDWPRVSNVSLSLFASTRSRSNRYHVYGDDKTRVDKIADQIETFGRQHRTWRGPEGADIAKNGSIALALLLLPVALVLRDRRGVWLLYPLSAVFFAASYLFPFDAVFNNLVIVGTR